MIVSAIFDIAKYAIFAIHYACYVNSFGSDRAHLNIESDDAAGMCHLHYDDADEDDSSLANRFMEIFK